MFAPNSTGNPHCGLSIWGRAPFCRLFEVCLANGKANSNAFKAEMAPTSRHHSWCDLTVLIRLFNVLRRRESSTGNKKITENSCNEIMLELRAGMWPLPFIVFVRVSNCHTATG
jgi:hypothetical protein